MINFELNKYRKKVKKIGKLESSLSSMTNEELANKTDEFRRKLEGGSSKDAILV